MGQVMFASRNFNY